MKLVRMAVMVIGLVGVMTIGTGCVAVVAGAAAGAGGYAYVKGEVQAEESVSVAEALDASKKALASLGFRVTSASKDALEGKVEASGAEGRIVNVKIVRADSGKTKIGVRVGTFGDRDQAAVILDTIRKKAGVL